MKVVHAYVLLLVVAVESAASGWLLLGTRGQDRGVCHQWVAGPTPVIACEGGHSYDGLGHDLGLNTPGGFGASTMNAVLSST